MANRRAYCYSSTPQRCLVAAEIELEAFDPRGRYVGEIGFTPSIRLKRASDGLEPGIGSCHLKPM